MGRTDPKRSSTVSKPLKLKLQARQKFSVAKQKIQTAKPAKQSESIKLDKDENVIVPQSLEVEQKDLDLFAQLEARLAAGSRQKSEERPEKALEKSMKEFEHNEILQHPAKDPEVAELYRRLGEILHNYRSGNLPKSFKMLPLMEKWKELIDITEPERWTPHAMLEAVKIFVAAGENDRTLTFFQSYFLPRIMKDVATTRQLNCHLFQALEKAVYRSASFFQGIVLAFMDSEGTTIRQAQIIAAAVMKKSMQKLHGAAALFQALGKNFTAPNGIILKCLIDKRLALPQVVVQKIVEWILKFRELEKETLPVLWFQIVLNFVRFYRKYISEDDKKKLVNLVKKKFIHEAMSPEIVRVINEPVEDEAQNSDDDNENENGAFEEDD